MFSGFGHAPDLVPETTPRLPEDPYRPLRQSKTLAGATYRLQARTPELRVHARSPATDAMTDLTRVDAVTTTAGTSIEDAQQVMIERRIRSLFVVDETTAVIGVITATDILGERPVQIAQRRGVRHAEIAVWEVMTPLELLETMDMQDVAQARVGDVVETLRRSGRQHALVIEGRSGAAAPQLTVRGIFSLTQIARQLGLPPQEGRTVARTFAEIEAAIGA